MLVSNVESVHADDVHNSNFDIVTSYFEGVEMSSAANEDFDKIHSIGDFKFQNQKGNWITQDDLEGKIYVANFFFSICPNICPLMMGNLLKVQDTFKSNPHIKILSHTVMPWIDSVGRLREYADFNGINAESWSLLTGDKKEIYELARNSYFADEGFGKTVTENDDFLHTENLVLIDQNRHIRGVYNGINGPWVRPHLSLKIYSF